MAQAIEFYITGDDSDGDAINAAASITAHGMGITIGAAGENVTFNVSSVDIKIKETLTPANNLIVAIYPALPDGSPDTVSSAIASGSVAVGTVGSTAKWVNVALTPVSTGTLSASRKYVLVCSSLAGTASDFWSWRGDAGGGYSGGGNYSGVLETDTWGAVQTEDKIVSINGGDYAGTLCTLADERNKAGANASTSSTIEQLVSDVV